MKKIGLFIVAILALAATGYAEDLEKRIERGFTYIESGDYNRAARIFKSITRSNPDNADAYVGLGISKLRLGNNEDMTKPEVVRESVGALQTAVRLEPSHPEGHYNLGIAYLAIDDKDGAIEEYEALKNTDNQLADQLHSQIKGHKITIYTKTGESGSKWQPTTVKNTGVEQPVYTEDPKGCPDVCSKSLKKGDRKIKVLERCGEPTLTEIERVDPHGNAIEVWTYNYGPGLNMLIVKFRKNKIRVIKCSGGGF